MHYTEQGFNLEYLLCETSRLYCKPTCSCNQRSLPPGMGRDSHMKGAGCSLSLLGLHVKKCIKIIYFTRFMQFRFTTVSFRVKTKVWATLRLTFRQLKGFHSNFRRASPPISYGVPSRVHCSTWRQTPFSVNSSSC